MTNRKRTDGTQKETVEWLRRHGWSVQITSDVGNGFPDLVAANQHETMLVECKSKTGKMSPEQIEFARKWRGKIFVCRGLDKEGNVLLKCLNNGSE